MAAELVSSATSEKLADVDWTKNIEICELAARDERYDEPDFFSFCKKWFFFANL